MPEIPPRGEGKIRIEWNTTYVNGPMEGQAIVRTSDPEHPRVSFAFRAVVTPPIEILPLPAAFFSVFEGETSEQTLRIVSHEEVPLVIQRLESHGQHFTAHVETVTPGKVFQLHVKVPAGVAPGRYMEAISLHTDQPQRGPISVPVNVLVKRELHVDPEGTGLRDRSTAEVGPRSWSPPPVDAACHYSQASGRIRNPIH